MRMMLGACLALTLALVGCGEDTGQGGNDDGGGADLSVAGGGDLSGGGGGDLSSAGGGDMTGQNNDDLSQASAVDMAGQCNMSQSCYNGPQGTAGKGVCLSGTSF